MGGEALRNLYAMLIAPDIEWSLWREFLVAQALESIKFLLRSHRSEFARFSPLLRFICAKIPREPRTIAQKRGRVLEVATDRVLRET